jgi:perosamine synthetase
MTFQTKINKISEPYIDKNLFNKIKKKIEKKEFSKFIGSPEPNIDKFLFKETKYLMKIRSKKSFFGGESVRNLEYLWSKKFKSKFAISVNSATSAITTAIMSLDIGPGDEIITTPFTFSASVAAILAANVIPIFADININTYCLDPNEVEKRITKKTKAILAVHWNSNCGELDKLKKIASKYSLFLIEDASQSHGMKYKKKFIGTIGDVGIVSFNEPKNIMTGEGGMIVTNNKIVAAKSRLIRNHGENVISDKVSNNFLQNIIGYNFRLPEILAEIGIFQLKKLNYLNNIRKKNYHYLIKGLNKHKDYLVPQKITNSTYFPYTVAFRWISKKINREKVLKIFKKNKIPVSTGLSRLISEHPILTRKIAYGLNGCPFSCHLYGKNYDVKDFNLTNSKKLNNEYLGFFQIGWPTNKQTMDEIINSFEEVIKKK